MKYLIHSSVSDPCRGKTNLDLDLALDPTQNRKKCQIFVITVFLPITQHLIVMLFNFFNFRNFDIFSMVFIRPDPRV